MKGLPVALAATMAAAVLAYAADGPKNGLDALAGSVETSRERHAAELENVKDERARFVLRLAQMREIDVLVRQAFFTLPTEPSARAPAAKKLDRIISATDAAHTAKLKALLERHGWPRLDVFPPQSDENAWLIVQHADLDLPFQKRVLALLEPMTKNGGTDPGRYAYLYDRVATNENRPQRYGTQGDCVSLGHWAPGLRETPEKTDALRRAIGLEPLADYVRANGSGCP